METVARETLSLETVAMDTVAMRTIAMNFFPSPVTGLLRRLSGLTKSLLWEPLLRISAVARSSPAAKDFGTNSISEAVGYRGNQSRGTSSNRINTSR